MEFFAQVKSGRVTKERLQDFLRNRKEVDEVPWLTEPPTRSQLLNAIADMENGDLTYVWRDALVFRLHYGLQAGRRYTEAEINKMLSSLREERVRQVVSAFQVLISTGKEYSLLEIGQMLSCTKERVKQIEKKARGRIRHRLPYKDELTKTLVRGTLKRND
jgi:DNA-directed RNA polymerase sigma subunit (sigma70/sigma32)